MNLDAFMPRMGIDMERKKVHTRKRPETNPPSSRASGGSMKEYGDDDEEDYEDDDQVIMLMGDAHLDSTNETEETQQHTPDRAFIVSKDSVQIVGYSVEDILALAETSQKIIRTLEHTPETKVGFR